MEHLGNITRRQLLCLGAAAAGSLLIPSIAYAASPENNEREGAGFIHRATITSKEGLPVADSSLNAPENAKLTKTYSLKGIADEHDEEWNLQAFEMYYWFPATVSSEKVPETVTYRMLQDGTGISLPYGSKASEITVSGEEATGYMQIWIYEKIAANKVNQPLEDEGWYDFEAACLREHQGCLFEIKVRYANGFEVSKRYSLLPGYEDEWGNLDSLVVAEMK